MYKCAILALELIKLVSAHFRKNATPRCTITKAGRRFTVLLETGYTVEQADGLLAGKNTVQIPHLAHSTVCLHSETGYYEEWLKQVQGKAIDPTTQVCLECLERRGVFSSPFFLAVAKE